MNKSKEEHELKAWLENYLTTDKQPTHEWHKPSINDLSPTLPWKNPFASERKNTCYTTPKLTNLSLSQKEKICLTI